jgi:dolichol-phosphate mannosyltransferase
MTAGFKLWKRSALLGIDLEEIRSNGYSFQVEMAYLCEKLGYRLIEIPIHFEDRRIGQSKLDIPVKLESAWRTWQIRWRYRGQNRRRQAGTTPRPEGARHRFSTMVIDGDLKS